MSGNKILTYPSCRWVDPFSLKGEDIDIVDIAHALSNICRFNGAVSRFYCVLEHSMRVASLLPPELRIFGLLHDAHEAYTGDIVRPIKQNLRQLDSLEHLVQKALMIHFRLPWDLPPRVKAADDTLLCEELIQLKGVSLSYTEEFFPEIKREPTIRLLCANNFEEYNTLRMKSTDHFLHCFHQYMALYREAAKETSSST